MMHEDCNFINMPISVPVVMNVTISDSWHGECTGYVNLYIPQCSMKCFLLIFATLLTLSILSPYCEQVCIYYKFKSVAILCYGWID